MRLVLKLLLCFVGLSLGTNAAQRPHIVWIEADDLMPRFMNELARGLA